MLLYVSHSITDTCILLPSSTHQVIGQPVKDVSWECEKAIRLRLRDAVRDSSRRSFYFAQTVHLCIAHPTDVRDNTQLASTPTAALCLSGVFRRSSGCSGNWWGLLEFARILRWYWGIAASQLLQETVNLGYFVWEVLSRHPGLYKLIQMVCFHNMQKALSRPL